MIIKNKYNGITIASHKHDINIQTGYVLNISGGDLCGVAVLEGVPV